MKDHIVIWTSDKVPQPGAEEAHTCSKFAAQTLHFSADQIFGDAQKKNTALRQ